MSEAADFLNQSRKALQSAFDEATKRLAITRNPEDWARLGLEAAIAGSRLDLFEQIEKGLATFVPRVHASDADAERAMILIATHKTLTY